MKNMERKELENLSVLSLITGSQMYGLNIDTSDTDEKHIVKVTNEMLYTIEKPWETSVFKDPDTEFHSIKKTMELLNSQNPTVLEMLYAKPEFILKQTPEGKLLMENREIFLSKNCYHSFGGYAKDQLMRIKNGLEKATLEDEKDHLDYRMNQMIGNLSKKYPEIKDGDFTLAKIEIDSMSKTDILLNIKPQQIHLTQLYGMLSELNSTLKQFNKVNNRNRKPEKKLWKHAMHLIRLLLSGIEILETGHLTVYQEKERLNLLKIRNAELTWDEIFDYIADLFDKLEQANKRSILPEKTNMDEINKLYLQLQR
jgi:predicted nucleotidyltransferase